MAGKKSIELSKVSFNLPTQLVERVKKYAYSKGINTTSAYIILLNNALDNNDVFANLPAILALSSALEGIRQQTSMSQGTSENFINDLLDSANHIGSANKKMKIQKERK